MTLKEKVAHLATLFAYESAARRYSGSVTVVADYAGGIINVIVGNHPGHTLSYLYSFKAAELEAAHPLAITDAVRRAMDVADTDPQWN